MPGKAPDVERWVDANHAQAETDQFRCGKCGKRKATYYQMQTRSADEPMTVSLEWTSRVIGRS
jgi:DNA-directed RNA polymerase subunit M/transcription elongation factor TFIIS